MEPWRTLSGIRSRLHARLRSQEPPSAGKKSQIGQFADRVVDELSTVGQSLIIPELNSKVRQFFGLDFSELLTDMRGDNRDVGSILEREL